MIRDSGRLPQTSSASNPFAGVRRRPSKWALRLLWASLAFGLAVVGLLLGSLLG